VKQLLQSIETMNFIEADARRKEMASDIAARIGMGIIHAAVIQIAFEFGTTLISLDAELMREANSIVKTKTVDEFITA